jgi:hypothetical protein
MGAPKGHKKYGGGNGRPKGLKNKFTINAKEAFQFAFDNIGGKKQLARWAKNNQSDFYKLYAKLIPVDLTNSDKTLAPLFVKNVPE